MIVLTVGVEGYPCLTSLEDQPGCYRDQSVSHGSFEIFKCMIELREKERKGGREGGREGERKRERCREVKRYKELKYIQVVLLWYFPLLILVLILYVLFEIISNL